MLILCDSVRSLTHIRFADKPRVIDRRSNRNAENGRFYGCGVSRQSGLAIFRPIAGYTDRLDQLNERFGDNALTWTRSVAFPWPDPLTFHPR